MGHVVEVLTLDDPQQDYLREFPLPLHAIGPSTGVYRYNRALVPWLKRRAGDYDAVIVDGLWQYQGFGARRALQQLRQPYFVFVHGMLDPWFRHTYPLKHLKKWLYWPWGEYRVLRDAKAVLFTCAEERRLASESFWLYRATEKVVTYGTAQPPTNAEPLRELFLAQHPELRGRRVLLFLSRIHEKKGCDLLVKAFAKVAGVDKELHLVMAGPDQTGWLARLSESAVSLGIADRITWAGMLKDEIKWGAFYSAEAFVLPSHQENFGIAVAEALGCGLPVLISDKVNIWSEILADGAGLVEPDTQIGTNRLLQRWIDLKKDDRARMSECARKSFRTRFTAEAMATGLLEAIT